MKFATNFLYGLVLSSLGAVGCAEIPSDSGVSLNQPLTVVTAALPTSGSVHFNAKGGTVAEPRALDFTVKGLDLLAHSEDGVLHLDDLELGLGDITIGAEALPPAGLQLTNVTVNLQKAVKGVASKQSTAELAASFEIPVSIRADLVLDVGKTYPLGPVAVKPLATSFDLRRNGAATELLLSARCEGACWDVPGVANFQDGQIDVVLPVTVTNN